MKCINPAVGSEGNRALSVLGVVSFQVFPPTTHVNGEKAGTEVLATITDGKASVEPISALVLVKSDSASSAADADNAAQGETAETQSAPAESNDATSASSGNSTGIIVGVVVVALAVAGIAFAAKKKKGGQ